MKNSATIIFALAAMLLSSCMLSSLKDNLDEMEHLARISGDISAEDWDGSPVVVGLLRLAEVDGAPDHPFDRAELHGPGEYYFIVPPGRYRVVAYEDSNRDFLWTEGAEGERGERIAAYNNFGPVEVRAAELRGRVDIRITDRPIRNRPTIAAEDARRHPRAVGTVMPLDSPRFGPTTGPRGLWMPMEFLEDPGWGVFFLEEYDPNKVPVLFVHGISGYPQEFTALIEGLDRERFQPWVVHYPSGFELGIVASALERSMNELRHTHHYDHLCLVAHSMGGVLSRLYLNHFREMSANRVHTFVTIDSPLGGMASAAMGVSSAPVVVPSWTNLDPAGNTIPTLYDRALPEGTEYHLFFGHVNGETDSVVSLASQLRPEAMAEATSMRGFSNTHTGVLRAPETSRHLNAALARCGELPAAPEADAAAVEADTSEADDDAADAAE